MFCWSVGSERMLFLRKKRLKDHSLSRVFFSWNGECVDGLTRSDDLARSCENGHSQLQYNANDPTMSSKDGAQSNHQ